MAATEPMLEPDDAPEARLFEIFGQVASDGPQDAGELIAHFYGELKRIANACMSNERPSHTLQATALVNELYLRMHEDKLLVCDRQHFLAVAARVMRRILVDHARGRGTAKRGSGGPKISLEDISVSTGDPKFVEVLAVNDILDQLADRQRRALELQYFLGLELTEIADQLDVSVATVKTDLRYGKALLKRQMSALCTKT